MLANGEKIEWEGKEYNPLYRAKEQTIIDYVGITEDEQRLIYNHFGKPILCNKEIAREHNTKVQTEIRRKKGVQERSEYDAKRKESSEEQRIRALELRNQGLSQRKISEEMGVSQSSIRDYLKSE